jgi:hypothetical protein
MRTLAIATVALSFIGAAAIGTTAPVWAQGVYVDVPGVHVGVGGRPYYHRHHHNYYAGGTYNGCRPGWTVQGGNCAPYHGYRGPGPGPGWYR